MAEKITMKDMLANLPQKTDVDTVVGRDASGNPVCIKKSDLAQVVAELIPVATSEKNGLMSKDLLPIKFEDLHDVDSLKIGRLNNREQCFLIISSHPYSSRFSAYLVVSSYINPSFVITKIILKEGKYFELYYDDNKYVYAKTVGNIPIDILVVPFRVNLLTMEATTLPSSITKM